MEGLGLTGCQGVFQEPLAREKEISELDCGDPIGNYGEPATLDAFPITRSKLRSDTTISTPAANNIISGERDIGGQETRTISPVLEHNKLRWKNVPKQPIPELQDISKWIGHQLNHKRMPKEYQNTPPDGKLISSLKGHPEGLLAMLQQHAVATLSAGYSHTAYWYVLRISHDRMSVSNKHSNSIIIVYR